jgi:purine-nucleoside phosphorylase
VSQQPAVPDLADPATDPLDVARAAAAVIADRTGASRHDVALVLGSGWGQTADLIGETLASIDNADVPGFAKAAVEGHSGTMRSVAIGDTGRRALVFGTRTHFYEGRGVRAVVHAVRTAAAAGCGTRKLPYPNLRQALEKGGVHFETSAYNA